MNAENSGIDIPRLVGEAYRELSTERTPGHLDQAVLERAAIEVSRSRSYRFAGWMKPLAWTAVIALSLAVVLHLAELQTLSTPDSVADREITRTQPAKQQDARERAESVAKPMSRKASVAPAGCDDATRASRDDWTECIRKLRESGAVELADREYEAFKLAYPLQSTTNK